MKKFFTSEFSVFFVVCLAVVLSAGCCHSQVFTEPLPADTPAPRGMQAVAYGRAQNSGYYLFNLWPLHTGHPYHPNRKDYRSWHNDITPEVNEGTLLASMKLLYEADRLINVEHQESAWGYFSLWIVWRKTVSTTAVALKPIKNKKAKKEEE